MPDRVMTYAKYAEAFKNGGFVMSPPVGGGLPDPFSFAPEYAEGFEVGFKSRLLDNRMELNAAAYYTEYTDLQMTVFISASGDSSRPTQARRTHRASSSTVVGPRATRSRWALRVRSRPRPNTTCSTAHPATRWKRSAFHRRAARIVRA